MVSYFLVSPIEHLDSYTALAAPARIQNLCEEKPNVF